MSFTRMIPGRSAPDAPAGSLRLAVPDGYDARWLSDPADAASVERWIGGSLDASVYNARSYIEFARACNGRADLLWLVRDGNPVLGLPLHPVGNSRVTTGYSGAMFAGAGESALRRGVTALCALIEANSGLGFQVLQCVQAPAYADPSRMNALACLLDSRDLRGPSLYSRVLELEPSCGEPAGAPDVSAERLLEEGMGPYQAELRNQIRQALRNGLQATCSIPGGDEEVSAAYREFGPLHRESWGRTGMRPHAQEYWTALSRAILEGGGRDLLVYVRDGDGETLAGVICHLRDGRALYWAGASRDRGLRLRANPLCLHAAIQTCRQLGVRSFELGRFDARERSQKELSVTRYKAQFGGGLVRVVSFQTQPPAATVVLRRMIGGLSRGGGSGARPRSA